MEDYISTHAPLAGRDDVASDSGPLELPISTHAPLAGRDWKTSYLSLS